jgi:hypothetical protein
MRRMVVVGMVALALSGCALGVHANFAPRGTGLAASAQGPGAEGALQDKNGVTLVSGSLAINPLALAADGMAWLSSLVGKLAPKAGQ